MCGTIQQRFGPPKCFHCGANIADVPPYEPERAARAARWARVELLKQQALRLVILLAVGGAVIGYVATRDPYQREFRSEKYRFEIRAHGDWIVADEPLTGAVASVALLNKQLKTLRNQPAIHVFVVKLSKPPANLASLSPNSIPGLQERMPAGERLDLRWAEIDGLEAMRIVLRGRPREKLERWLIYVVLKDGYLYEFRAAAPDARFDEVLPDFEKILSTVKFS